MAASPPAARRPALLQTTPARWVLVAGAFLTYLLLFGPLYHLAGTSAGVLALVPVAAIAMVAPTVLAMGATLALVLVVQPVLLVASVGMEPEQAWSTELLPVLLAALAVAYALSAMRRVAERRRRQMDEELQATQEELHRTERRAHERAERHRTELGVAAHDLRSPLATAALAAEELRDETQGRQEELAELVCNSIRRALQLVDELLEAHVVEDDEGFDLTPTDVVELTEGLLRLHRVQARAKGITLRFEAPADLPLVPADEVHLSRAIDNLLSNALKFSHPGTTATLRLRRSDDIVVLEIADEGPGLSHDDLGAAFGKLARLSARPTADEPSTGLGLYVVRSVAEGHGGRAFATSRGVGRGATFGIELPLGACHRAATGVPEAEETA